MNLDTFFSSVQNPKPSQDDISEILTFAQNADVDVVWEALQRPGLQPDVLAMLTNVLQHKIQSARIELGMLPDMESVPPGIAGTNGHTRRA